jgi:hypothetical protein
MTRRVTVEVFDPASTQATAINSPCKGVMIIYTELADSPALPGYLFIPLSIAAVDIAVVIEPLPSYQQFLIVGFCGYESCTPCLAMARLEHTYFLRQ